MPAQLKSLELWRHVCVASVRGDAPDLSARQMALMLSVYLDGGPHTVRGLATALKISKPAVSRALDRLGELGYVRRQRDELDHRNVLVQKTSGGAQFLTAFSQLVDDSLVHVASIPAQIVDFAVAPDPVPVAAPVLSPTSTLWAHEPAE
ncbi:MAG: MarR family transcriptional regulator [Alphaproteobacteria bacterium]|nr:MarR family transcriptional regulator [Alphaproteobacteria bacterium]